MEAAILLRTVCQGGTSYLRDHTSRLLPPVKFRLSPSYLLTLLPAPPVSSAFFSIPSSYRLSAQLDSGQQEERDACSYLTWYYCDFLAAAEDPNQAPPKLQEESLQVESLISWLNEFKPRTRMDAFPMLQVMTWT
eukprot:767201-Hanusia_phi.AAC.2